ncbi:MAG: nuclear transport factor 2 family protein [Rhodospirillales bacterium]
MAVTQKSLEDRIRAIEDRLEIYDLIARHPPSADTGATEYTRTVWVEDGVFDRQIAAAHGREEIAAGVATPAHRAAIEGGIGHFVGLPAIAIDGDTAVVINYLQILVPQTQGEPVEVANHGASKGYRVHRFSANRWELVRIDGRWKVARRLLRVIDGSEPARELLRGAVTA